jgi:uncharacterized protein (TIGR04255 family)
LSGTEHPTYPNPTIAEALCEVHFAYPTDSAWRARLAGEVFKLVQDDFPILEPRVETAFEIKAGPEGIGQHLLPPSHRMVFRHATKNLFFQLGEGVLTLNVLQPYPGWQAMSEDLAALWTKIHPVVKPSIVFRIGLRYINRIPRKPEINPVGYWLNPTDYIPAAPLKTHQGFFSRVSVTENEHNRIVVTLAENKTEGMSQIVLDIDRIVEEEIQPTTAELGKRISRMHDDVWRVFRSAMTDGLEDLLKETEG